MRSGTFQERKPFICAGTAEPVWTASRRFPYHRKTWGDFVHSVRLRGAVDGLVSAAAPLSFIYPRDFFFARVINWTIIILQYAHTHTGRSLKWQAGGVAWLFVEKLSITAQKAVTHDRQRIFPWNILQIQNNKLHACFVLEQQCAVIMHRLSVSAEIISTTGLLKGDERLHLDQQGGPQ